MLIKNGHVVDPVSSRNGVMDILVEEGKIVRVEKDIQETASSEVINADGMYVIPGLVDAHCHLRDPGFEYKEDIESGTKSAAAGGFTSVACMANTNPVADSESVIRYIISKAEEEGIVNVYPIGAITKGLKGMELSEIGELKFAGAVAISDDGYSVADASLMKKALQYASMFDITVISHCEDLTLTEDGLMNEGYVSTVNGLKGIPSAAEEVMVARNLVLAGYTGTRLHIAHVSTALSVELIRNAKRRGVPVTAETCPHYFTLTEDACSDFNTLAKVNPPLRTQADVDAIIEGLKDGTIDIIATDHAPHHEDEKNVEFELAANGMVGFETALPLAVTRLVRGGHLTIEDLVRKMCVNPSGILGLNKGSLAEGNVADITIFNTDDSFIVDTKSFKSKSRNSPFDEYKLFGKVCYTIIKGEAVVREGEIFV